MEKREGIHGKSNRSSPWKRMIVKKKKSAKKKKKRTMETEEKETRRAMRPRRREEDDDKEDKESKKTKRTSCSLKKASEEAKADSGRYFDPRGRKKGGTQSRTTTCVEI